MQTQADINKSTSHGSRIILIEEHAEVRYALVRTLMQQLDQTTVWAMPYLPSTAEELLEFNPDVILIGLPQQAIASLTTLLDQIDVWIKRQISVVTLAAYVDLDEVNRLNSAGVYATLLKTAASAEMIQTIKHAAKTSTKEKTDV